jgi:alpha-tubulin suppressor-like RCC1 family protein
VAAGGFHTCAFTSAGGLKCWGNNQYGQLGDGTYSTRLTPVDVIGLASGVMAVVAGEQHTCALTTAGGGKCWGYNQSGQLGDGTTAYYRLTPADVSGLTTGVTAMATHGDHTCAATSSGGVKCWGRNEFGQLGDGTTWHSNIPVDVRGLTSGITAVAAGGFHTCAFTSAGGLKCWGNNQYGQLGDGTNTRRLIPVDVSGLASGVTALATGYGHTCALTSGGGAKCWGDNEYGQLGEGTNTRRLTPVDVSGLASGVTALATGYGHTCALTSGGGVKCWGDNEYGQLGEGTNTRRLTPVDVSGLASGVTALAAGWDHTCVLISGGAVKCWGRNLTGSLGDGTDTDRNTPVDVNGLTTSITALGTGYGHICALTTAGGVRCWGGNWDGQLGDGTTAFLSFTPVDVNGLTSGVAAVAAGTAHTCAVTNGGGVKCWGDNQAGQLGDGTTTRRNVPVDVVIGYLAYLPVLAK